MGRRRDRRRNRTVLHEPQLFEPRLLMARVELVYEPDTSTASAFPDTGYQIVMNAQDAYFTAASTAGRELWTSNGTAAGTHLVKDIMPGAAGTFNNSIVPFGS